MSDDLRNRVARAIAKVAFLREQHAGYIGQNVTFDDSWITSEHYEMTDAALAEMSGVREDALREADGGPDWEGFARDLLEEWPVRDVEASEFFETALRHGLIREIPGGYDPEQHIDAEGIAPEKGDPWYEYAFRALIDRTAEGEA